MLRSRLVATVLLMSIFSFLSKDLKAQIEPHNFAKVTDVLPPAPNAAALAKYGGIEVSLNTGMLNKGITVCNLSSTNINVGVTLSYTSNGFKPAEMASRAGFGWVLNAGGVVTRTIVDEPDEYYTRKVPPMTIGLNAASYDFLYKTDAGYWDVEPDQYSFNFNGYTGRFVYDENDEVVFMPANNLKVEKSLFATDWNFKITTPDGLVYYFGGNTATESTKSEGGCGKSFGPSYRPSSWYLKKIKSPLGDSMVFVYQSLMYEYPGPATQNLYKNSYNNVTDGSSCLDILGNPQPCPNYEAQSQLCGSTLRTMGVLLKEITTPNAGSIKFDYISRTGYADKLYSKVTVLDNNNVTKNIFELNYQHVYTTLFNNSYSANSTRPFLVKVIERSTDLVQTREHEFTYHKLDSLPVEHSFSQDHWGYYNGKNNASCVEKSDDFYVQALYPDATADKTPSAHYARMGLLSRIKYPTGGYDSIEYEANDYYGNTEIKPALSQLNVTATGTGNWNPVTVNSANQAIGYQQAVKLNYTIVDNTGNGSYDPVHNKGTVTVTNVTTSTIVLEKVSIPDGIMKSEVFTMVSGNTYRISATANGTAVTTNINLYYRPGSATNYTGNIETAGVRVKKASTRTDAGAVPIVKRYHYAKSVDSLSYSSGALPATPQYLREFAHRFACIVQTSPPQCFIRWCNYGALQSTSLTNMNIYPSGYTYGVVIESAGENFENGATEHRFTIKSDQGTINLMTAYSGETIAGTTFFNDSYYNGLEVRTTVYGRNLSQFVPISKTENNYRIDSRKTKDVYGASVQARYGFCPGDANAPHEDMINAWNASLYAHQSRWIYIDTVKLTRYDQNGSVATTSYQYFTYDNINHLQVTRTETTNSLGELTATETKYPGDFGTLTGAGNITVGIKNLQTLGVQVAQVESVIYRQQPGSGTKRVLGGKFTSYKTTLPLPDSIFQVETTTPITNFSFAANQSGSVVKDSRYKKQLSYLQYDARGNLLSQQKEKDQPISYIWDYKGTYPVAQVQNASSSDIAYTSFETTGTGNFTVSGGSFDAANAITGKRSYTLSTGNTISRSGLNIGVTYLVTYWSRNGSLTVNSGSGTAGTVRNGWTYYSHSFTGSSSVSISKTGSATIDELRLFPRDAMMATATMDPLRGVTTQTDPLNKITYYEYDGFSRLHIVRDQLGYILKRICYNYSGQPEFCNTSPVYYNAAVSDTFTRNDCGPGYYGTDVIYTIPDSSYGSLISLIDANQQAQAALTANGQTYANLNGTCLPLLGNVVKSGNFTRNNCGHNYTGGTVTYTVPANTYYAPTQLQADQLAQNAVNANGQAYANTNGSCTLTCSSGNCTGLNKKCINGACQTGFKIYTGYVQLGPHLYECTYHYEWSDGSWSPNYTEQSATPCIES